MKIVCFYDIEKYKNEERVFAPSTATVIDYIAHSLNRLNIPVEIVSPAETRKSAGKYPMRSEMISEGVRLTQCASNGHRNKLLRIISKIRSRLWLVRYLKKNTVNNELILSWDSPVLYEPLLIFRLLDRKKTKLLYYASEIYQEVIPLNYLKRRMEWKLFKKADMFLVSTSLLERKINKNQRKSLVLHGTYKVNEKIAEESHDGKIHVLYAGIINSSKGSSMAVEIASYLPECYRVHIIGYGRQDDIDALKVAIATSNENNSCKIVYDGVLLGEDYSRYLQRCDVGICSQDLNAKYNNSSFPSKILSYMANGLRVVSVDLEAVRTSKIGDFLFFSASDSAEDIAKAIMEIDIHDEYDSRRIINELDCQFVRSFEEMLKGHVVCR
ncbi:MAG: glycosyltransferase family 4 protein [Lachnospiraceae bacterium]|nr:glycosyltransferase family 4 protein [Lachnospiraceae bacterium]